MNQEDEWSYKMIGHEHYEGKVVNIHVELEWTSVHWWWTIMHNRIEHMFMVDEKLFIKLYHENLRDE